MSSDVLPMAPQEATKILLQNLPSRRMKDVIEKRFGLKKGSHYTLEAIGRDYKITRERVRQIESDAIKNLRKEDMISSLRPLLTAVRGEIERYGGVVAEEYLFSRLCDARYYPHLSFLMRLDKSFHCFPETDKFSARIALSRDAAERFTEAMTAVLKDLEAGGKPVSRSELETIVQRHVPVGGSVDKNKETARVYLGMTRLIRENPYGEYGLNSWATIRPRGVRDKAYVVLAKAAAPLHFRHVASAIDKAGWSKNKKAHPQTVHNELIKDNRFVLVGRGMYALTEWGYEPGVVREVVVSILKRAGKPLHRDEVVRLVTEKRFVKPQTVILNLQNRSLFKKTSEGTYTLV